MPALTDRSTRTGAGVRKPSGDETAGRTPARAGRHRPGYGDFAAGSGLRVAESIGSTVDFAASASRELVRNGAAGVLPDEIRSF
jgi:hypothetical protein